MTDEAAFLAAVRAAPNDNLPRLVYADWLDERGQDGDAERAEFIRLMVAMADDWNADSLARARHLVASTLGLAAGIPKADPGPWDWDLDMDMANEGGVLRLVVFDYGPDLVRYSLSRGFVDRVRLSGRRWVDLGSGLVARHPLGQVVLASSLPLVAYRVDRAALWLTIEGAPDQTGIRVTEDMLHLQRLQWPWVAEEWHGYLDRHLLVESWGTRDYNLHPHSPRPEIIDETAAQRQVRLWLAGRLPGLRRIAWLAPWLAPRQPPWLAHEIICGCQASGLRLPDDPTPRPLVRLCLHPYRVAGTTVAFAGHVGRCSECQKVYATEPMPDYHGLTAARS